jgi:histidine ammonia-lyase
MADLAPMAHAALALIGLGEVERADGSRQPASQALAEAGLDPIVFGPKDGLTLTSSTAPTVGYGTLVTADLARALHASDVAAALSFEGFSANVSPLDGRAMKAHPVPGQLAVADHLRTLLDGSRLWQSGVARDVQDPLSFRCVPQVHGTSRELLRSAEEVLTLELNSSSDNPLVVPEEGAVISHGSFHTGRIALAFDALSMGLAQQATLAVNRLMRLMSPQFTGFPAYLTQRPGINCGFATLQKTFVGLAAEIRHLANPGSLDPLPLAEGVEDHGAMPFLSIGKLREAISQLEYILACELMAAAQAVDLLGGPVRLGKGTRAAYELVRGEVAFLEDDRVLTPDIERLRALIAAGKLRCATS